LTWQWRPTGPQEALKDLVDLLKCLLVKAKHNELVQRYATSTERTSAKRPALGINNAFQVGSLSANLSTTGWNTSPNSRLINSGMPRYFTGKGANWHFMAAAAPLASSSEQAIGETNHLAKLVCNPDACLNSSRMLRIARNSVSSGWQKMTTSST
jgi:hypothetical protein